MTRLELYLHKRRNKRLVWLTIIISLIVILFGLTTVDSAVHTMLGVDDEIKLLDLTKKRNAVYELTVMNTVREVNLIYLKKDLEIVFNEIKDKLSK